MSRPYAEVIGNPISHSKSPLIHNFWLGKLGIDAEYRACHVRPEELADYFKRRRGDVDWRGCNVTIPHKIAVLEFVDDIDETASLVGATNCVVPGGGHLLGMNTDVEGVAGPINVFHESAFNFRTVPPRKVGIIGAGGAARAAVAALMALGWVGEWRIAVRKPERGEELLRLFGLEGKGKVIEISDQKLSGVDILLNASTMGMGDVSDSPLTLAALGNGSTQPLVFDMVYSPHETGLIRAAKKQGHAVIYGLDMLIAQASGAFTHLFGERPPRDTFSELRALLIA